MTDTPASRRTFLKSSAVAAVATPLLAPGAFAAAGGILRIGLVGCGGRGTAAASEALQADPNVKLVAMCDAFMDRLDESLRNLTGKRALVGKIDVPKERRFDGFEGYKKLLDCVDVVLLCTPPGFRPQHLRAAIEAGKHVFCEKPVAVDAPGVRSVIETAKLAKEKKLSLCSGFCYRYEQGKRETVKRVHDGLIGDVTAMHITYLTSPIWFRKERDKCDSEMEYQMRNWYYYTWLSGDFIVEQHCHNMDKAAWVFQGEMPTACTGVGGRQVRTDPKYGNIYDHFAVTFEYKGGVRLFSACRQMGQCHGDVNDYVIGTKGTAHLMRHTVSPAGGAMWGFDGESKSMYQVEHDELFAGIRADKPINDGEAAAYSTLMAIMARQAAYTGKKITWKEMLNSAEDLSPRAYAWGDNEVPGVATPGVTKFV